MHGSISIYLKPHPDLWPPTWDRLQAAEGFCGIESHGDRRLIRVEPSSAAAEIVRAYLEQAVMGDTNAQGS